MYGEQGGEKRTEDEIFDEDGDKDEEGESGKNVSQRADGADDTVHTHGVCASPLCTKGRDILDILGILDILDSGKLENAAIESDFWAICRPGVAGSSGADAWPHGNHALGAL
ncbi:hypothetical protein G7Z17_g11419 [Cylindrodendrum hubeiense]|uniref:Uncharacterized protein n=1 Tax=Cylindrodendrum hubeiense TaxID=595255 RepID=A0A9P5GX53_9HYPO|nr:hypothetical protein G7Z17_g11419 [Cylindrodendrum hubeiense]